MQTNQYHAAQLALRYCAKQKRNVLCLKNDDKKVDGEASYRCLSSHLCGGTACSVNTVSEKLQ